MESPNCVRNNFFYWLERKNRFPLKNFIRHNSMYYTWHCTGYFKLVYSFEEITGYQNWHFISVTSMRYEVMLRTYFFGIEDTSSCPKTNLVLTWQGHSICYQFTNLVSTWQGHSICYQFGHSEFKTIIW